MRHTPLGYQMRRGKIVIIEKYAKTVRWIFDSYVNGVSQKSIARQLSEQRVPTATGKYNWSQCSIRSILTNHKYMGDDYHPRIIEPYLFESAQARREEKNNAVNSHPKTAYQQPLSGKCRCGKCGGTYRYVKGVWRCGNYIKDNSVSCDNDLYADEELLKAVITVFQYLKENCEYVIAEKEVVEKKTSIEVNKLKAEIKKARKEMVLPYKEYRELVYQRASERYKISPIWNRDYLNNKLQNFLKFNDIDMVNIKEITEHIKTIQLFPKREIILVLSNELNFKYELEVME